ncbi:hypothetical protein G3I23_26975, partial [Streptomyces sp. SID10115]|nr:hypothetical protein [Streptomyces sp. SID10115]
MTNSVHPHGRHRAPLPPAQVPAAGVPTPRAPHPPPQAAPTTPPTPAGRSTAHGGPKPAKQRDAFFDNAKYLAIVLV